MFKYSALKKELKQRFGKALAVTLSAAMLVGAVPADLLGGFSSVKADDVNTNKNVWSADENADRFDDTIFTLDGTRTLVKGNGTFASGLALSDGAKITFKADKDGELKVWAKNSNDEDESSAAVGSSDEADASSDEAGASSDEADASSDVAGASSDEADASSDVAGASSDEADASSDAADASSDVADASSDAADASSDVADASSDEADNTNVKKTWDYDLLKTVELNEDGAAEVDGLLVNVANGGDFKDNTTGWMHFVDTELKVPVSEGKVMLTVAVYKNTQYKINDGEAITAASSEKISYIVEGSESYVTIAPVGESYINYIEVEPLRTEWDYDVLKAASIQGKTGAVAGINVDATTGKFADNTSGWMQFNDTTVLKIPTTETKVKLTVCLFAQGTYKISGVVDEDDEKEYTPDGKNQEYTVIPENGYITITAVGADYEENGETKKKSCYINYIKVEPVDDEDDSGNEETGNDESAPTSLVSSVADAGKAIAAATQRVLFENKGLELEQVNAVGDILFQMVLPTKDTEEAKAVANGTSLGTGVTALGADGVGSIDAKEVKIDGEKYGIKNCYKTGGAGSATKRALGLTITAPATVKIGVCANTDTSTTDNSSACNVIISKKTVKDGTTTWTDCTFESYKLNGETTTYSNGFPTGASNATLNIIEVDITAGDYSVYTTGGARFYILEGTEIAETSSSSAADDDDESSAAASSSAAGGDDESSDAAGSSSVADDDESSDAAGSSSVADDDESSAAAESSSVVDDDESSAAAESSSVVDDDESSAAASSSEVVTPAEPNVIKINANDLKNAYDAKSGANVIEINGNVTLYKLEFVAKGDDGSSSADESSSATESGSKEMISKVWDINVFTAGLANYSSNKIQNAMGEIDGLIVDAQTNYVAGSTDPKFALNSDGTWVQFNAQTMLKVPVDGTSAKVTVVVYNNGSYKINDTECTALASAGEQSYDEVAVNADGYIVITATSNTYIKYIKVEYKHEEPSSEEIDESKLVYLQGKLDLSNANTGALDEGQKFGSFTVAGVMQSETEKWNSFEIVTCDQTFDGVTYNKELKIGTGAITGSDAPKRLVTFTLTEVSKVRLVLRTGSDKTKQLNFFTKNGDAYEEYAPYLIRMTNLKTNAVDEVKDVANSPEMTNDNDLGKKYLFDIVFSEAGTYGFYVPAGAYNLTVAEIYTATEPSSEASSESSSEAGSESSSEAATESSSAAATESSSAAGSEPSSEPSSNPNPSSDKEGLLAYLVAGDEEYVPSEYPYAVYTGSAIKPVVRVYYDDKVLTEGVDYAVKYKNNTKVTEAAIITISGKGNFAGSSQAVNFKISPADLSEDVKYPAKMTVEVGQKVAPILMNGDKKLGAKDFKLENVEGSPAQMDAKYKFTAVTEEGSPAKVRVTAGPSGNYKSDSYAEIEVTVVAKGALKANKLAVDVKGAKGISFKDENKDPQSLIDAGKIVITSKDGKSSNAEGDSKLEKDTDYIVVCSSNTDIAGTVKFTVVGCGAYGGSVAKSYKIDPAKGGNIAVDLGLGEDNSIEFTPSGAKPSNVTVTYTDGDFSKELTEGVDYKISYSGNKKAPAAAKAKLTFLGNYKGNKVAPVTYSVIKAKVSNNDDALMVKVPDKAYDANNKPNKSYKSVPVVTYKGEVIKSSNYTVTYKTVNSSDELVENKKANITLSGDDLDATVYVSIVFKDKATYEHVEGEAELTGSYVVRKTGENGIDLSKAKVTFYSDEARTQQIKSLEYNNGKGFYTPGDGNDTDADDSVAEPKYVKVEVNKAEVASENYKVTWLNSTEKGKATVVIEGANGSVGSKNATIAVKAKSLKNEGFLEKVASNIIGNLF